MPTRKELIDYIKSQQSSRCPGLIGKRKNELKQMAENLGYGDTPPPLPTTLPPTRTTPQLPTQPPLPPRPRRPPPPPPLPPRPSKLKVSQILRKAAIKKQKTKIYYSVPIKFQYRPNSDTIDTTWRDITYTFSTDEEFKSGDVRNKKLIKKALKAASDEAQKYMDQRYTPEIRNLEILNIQKIRYTKKQLKDMKLYANGFHYTNLAMTNEFNENNQCVYDFLKSQYPKFFNQLKDYEKEYLVGITPASLYIVLMRININTSIIIEDLMNRPIISHLVPNNERSDIKPIMLKVANNHIYHITDKYERVCMRERAKIENNGYVPNTSDTKKKKIPITEFIPYNIENIKSKISECQTLTTYYTNAENLNELFNDYLIQNIAPCVKLTNNNITEITQKKCTIKCLPDGLTHYNSMMNMKKYILDKLNTKIKSNGYGAIAQELFDDLKFKFEKSQFNTKNRELFDYVCTGALIKNYNSIDLPRKRFYGIDKKNAYPSALLELLNQIPVYDVNDYFEYFKDGEFNTVEPCSFYLVEHNNLDVGEQLLHSNALLGFIKIGLIKNSQVKAVLRGRPMQYGQNDICKFIKICLEIPNGKYLINSFIGLQAKSEHTRNNQNIITRSRDEAVYYYLNNGDPLNHQFMQFNNPSNPDDPNNQYYIVALNETKILSHISKPLYLAVIQYTRMLMLTAKYKLENLGCIVSSIKTDALYYAVPNSKKRVYNNWAKHNIKNKSDVDIGQFKREDAAKIDKVYNEQKQITTDENKDAIEGKMLKRTIDINEMKKSNNKIDFIQLHKPTIDDIIKYDSCIISGAGGSGKSYLCSQIIKHYESKDLKIKVLSPTNISANVLQCNLDNLGAKTQSKTLHSGLSIGYDNTIRGNGGISKFDVLITDEISMLTRNIWGMVLSSKIQNPDLKIYAFGDYRQLPPIENYAIPFTELNIINEIFEIQFELTYNYRTGGDAEFVNKCKDIHDKPDERNKLIKSLNLNNNIEDFAICRTNRVRKSFNEEKMNDHKAQIQIVISDTLDNLDFKIKDEHKAQLQDMKIYTGLPLQCIIKPQEVSKKLKYPFIKRQFFTVRAVDIVNDIIFITNENNDEFKITAEHLAILLIPAYACTIHSIQGKTLNKPYTILEWNNMTNKQIYTALTRTTNYKNISLSNKLFGCSAYVLQHIYKLQDSKTYGYIYKSNNKILYSKIKPDAIEGKEQYIRKIQYYDYKDIEKIARTYTSLLGLELEEYGTEDIEDYNTEDIDYDFNY